jgi:hypothetical protein
MNITEKPIAKTKSTALELVNGVFNRSEANDILRALIDEKIKFYKIQKWQKWEADHSCNSVNIDTRIEDLQNGRKETRQWLENLNYKDCKIKVESTLKISIEN